MAARPLRSEFVTGNYFSTLGVSAFGGRVLTPEDDRPPAPPVAVLSHHVLARRVRRRPGRRRLDVRRRRAIPLTIVGDRARRDFSAKRCAAIRHDCGFRCSRSRSSPAENSLLRQSVSAWLRVIGRLRPGASTDGMAPRLTELLRQWMQHESGYPSNWMPDIIRDLPKQVINVVPAGRRRWRDEGGVRPQPADPAWRLRPRAPDRLRQRRQPPARARDRVAAARPRSGWRLAPPGRRSCDRRWSRACCCRSSAESPACSFRDAAARLLLGLAFRGAQFLPISTRPSLLVLAFAFSVALVTGIIFGAAPAWFATRTDPIDALRGAGRSTGDHSSFARQALLIVQATLSVVLVAGCDDAGAEPEQARNAEFRVPRRGARRRVA